MTKISDAPTDPTARIIGTAGNAGEVWRAEVGTEPSDLIALRAALRKFALERDWEKFHNPKNLAIAMSVEASEVLEHFQWLTPEEAADLSPARRQAVADELADVLIYLIRLADILDVDLGLAVAEKLEKNALKYPVDRVRGKALKYNEYK